MSSQVETERRTEVAVLAGGCFWGVEDILLDVAGVIDTEVGYTGGWLENPRYDDTHDSQSGHAEAVRVTFDPSVLSYEDLLEQWFFRLHDPTTLNRQGNDVGTQYRSAIFPHTRALELALTRLRRLAPNAFRSVFRHFPLRDVHPHAQMAAEAAEVVYALGGADAFWVMHDGLFAHQDQLDQPGVERRGAEAGVDPAALRAQLEAGRSAERVQRDVESGAANGVDRTPSVFINGDRYLGPRDVATLGQALKVAR